MELENLVLALSICRNIFVCKVLFLTGGFLGLDEVTLSNLRVIDRSESGGHYVDPKTVEDNFFGNLEKLNIHYEMFNSVQIIDTSENKHKVLCVLKNGETSNAIAVTLLPFWFHQYLPSITKRIADQATKLS